MLMSRRRWLTGSAVLALVVVAAPALAQRIVQIERSSPERKAILDVALVPVERMLGINVVFVVKRLAVFGDWAFADLALAPRRVAESTTAAPATRVTISPISTATRFMSCCGVPDRPGRSSSGRSCQPTWCGKNGNANTGCRAGCSSRAEPFGPLHGHMLRSVEKKSQTFVGS